MARDRNTDVVEVAPTAVPSVCRLMDYGKYKYQQIKKERQARRSQRATEVREIRLRPKISPHDVEGKIRLILRLLGEDNKVKVYIIFRGRELTHPELGWKVLQGIMDALKDKAILERSPSMEGRNRMSIVLAPLPAKQAKGPQAAVPKVVVKETVNAKA